MAHNKDALFGAWDSDRRSADPRPLSEWVSDNPDCAEDLMQWAADSPLRDQAELFAYPDHEAIARLEGTGTKIIAEMRARYVTGADAVSENEESG